MNSEPEISKKATSIPAFCAEHDMGTSTYYNLKKAGLAPTEIHIGRKRLISNEAAAAWRVKMEALAQAKEAAP